MREIKFRAWFPLRKEMIPWETVLTWRDLGMDLNDHEIISTKYMQYTGLLDKNGREIYEGDIVFTSPNGNQSIISYGKQEWEENFGDIFRYIGFNHPIGGHEWGCKSEREWDEYEVIGNIYENPELLEERCQVV